MKPENKSTSFLRSSLGKKLIKATFFLSLAFGAASSALSIPAFNTGVNEAGKKLPSRTMDPHWVVVGGPGINLPAPAFVHMLQGGNYKASTASSWIWVLADGSIPIRGGNYTFRLSFDLTGFDEDSAILSGAWGADNWGKILLNGENPVGTGDFDLYESGGPTNFNSFHQFNITGGFIDGINNLDITVQNSNAPGGLNVTNLILNARPSSPLNTVPEPPSWALLFTGLLAIIAKFQSAGVNFLPRQRQMV